MIFRFHLLGSRFQGVTDWWLRLLRRTSKIAGRKIDDTSARATLHGIALIDYLDSHRRCMHSQIEWNAFGNTEDVHVNLWMQQSFRIKSCRFVTFASAIVDGMPKKIRHHTHRLGGSQYSVRRTNEKLSSPKTRRSVLWTMLERETWRKSQR